MCVKIFQPILLFFPFPMTIKPTGITDTTKSLTDQIWTTQVEDNVDNYDFFSTDNSDHHPIFSLLKDNQIIHPPIFITKRFINDNPLLNFNYNM